MSYQPTATLLLATALLLAAPALATDIIAHRGASHDAPENTLASARLAWEQNADAVETDIYLTKDGKLIVSHDKTPKRTTGSDLSIPERTFAELRTLDAGSWKSPRYAGEKLPALDEQLALIPPGKRMFIEIKTGAEIVPELKRTLEKNKAGKHNITIISFNYDALKAVREQLPDLPTLYLSGYKKPAASTKKKSAAPSQPTLDALIAQARAAGLTGLDLQDTWPLTPADTQKIKAAGLQLHVWTIDDPAKAKHWIALGAASITTNRPGWLREQLQQ